MGWAAPYIAKLQAGETVSFRPRGRSMEPRIMSGALCWVVPVDAATIHKIVGQHDVVLCRVHGADYLHLVSDIRDGQWQISNNHHRVNGWIGAASVYGKLIRVDP